MEVFEGLKVYKNLYIGGSMSHEYRSECHSASFSQPQILLVRYLNPCALHN